MTKLALTTTRAQAMKKVNILIYGTGKVGKTTLTLTLPCDKTKILYVGADPGELALRGYDIPSVSPRNGVWDESTLMELYDFALEHRKDYEWIVIDGLDTIGNEVNYNHHQEYKDGRKAWEQTATFMDRWIRRVRDINGMSSLWITHPAEKADDLGKISFKPQMPGNFLKDNINNYFDVIGFMRQVRAADGELVPLIQFTQKPNESYAVGDRSGMLLDFEAPNMTAIVTKIKDGGMSFSDFSGAPTVGEIEALKQIIKLDKSGKKKGQVEAALKAAAVNSPSELTREQFNGLMKDL